MIVGKNDETKGFKVYLPHKKLVVTMQHVKNVETMGVEKIINIYRNIFIKRIQLCML